VAQPFRDPRASNDEVYGDAIAPPGETWPLTLRIKSFSYGETRRRRGLRSAGSILDL
jgi:hypothetical protein